MVRPADIVYIANMVAQIGLREEYGRPPIRYGSLHCALEVLRDWFEENVMRIKSLSTCPRIDLAGGKWEEIEPLIERTLVAAGIDVYGYDLPVKTTVTGRFDTSKPKSQNIWPRSP